VFGKSFFFLNTKTHFLKTSYQTKHFSNNKTQNTCQKAKHDTLFRKLPTTSYGNILRKHVLIFSSVEVDFVTYDIFLKKI
jgi:hypothetical protein